MKVHGNMETEDPSSALHLHQNGTIENLVGGKGVVKRRINRCRVCQRKFTSRDLYIAHVKLHKVTRRLSKCQGTTNKTPEKVKDLVYECRICGTKHVGFLQCFEHQRLHEQHSKYFNEVSTAENNRYHHLNSNNKHEEPAEVIIAKPEDVELLAANTIINESCSHGDNDPTNEIQSSDGECFISGNVNGNIIGVNDVNDVNGVDTCNVVFRDIDTCNVHVNDIDACNGKVHDEVNVGDHTTEMDEICTDNETDVLQHKVHVPITFPTHIDNQPARCKLADGDHAMQIDIPRHVKAIYLNNVGSDLGDVFKKLDELDQKVNAIIKHLNKTSPMGNHIPVESEDGILVHAADQEKELESEDSESVILETFPPSYSIIQAAKEQQQQEYYAATIASRQGQLFKANESQKGVEAWLPGQPYLSSLSSMSGSQEEELECKSPLASSASSLVPKHVIEKVFIESRSRANFAKNMCFAIFSLEERQGKNCTGRVFGKAQHKGQLDPARVQAIKDATFRKYPCNPVKNLGVPLGIA